MPDSSGEPSVGQVDADDCMNATLVPVTDWNSESILTEPGIQFGVQQIWLPRSCFARRGGRGTLEPEVASGFQ